MTSLLIVVLLLYLTSIAFASISFATTANQERFSYWFKLLAALGFLLHSASLISSWIKLGHFPIVNFKEVCSFIAWAIGAYYLLVIRRYQMRILPIFSLSIIAVLLIISLHWPSPDLPSSLASAMTDDFPISLLLPVHVGLLLFSYAAFLVTVGSGVMYLVQEHELKAKHFGTAFRWLPALNTCDEIAYRSMTVGFVSLTLGIVAGMIWGKQHDGRFWHNDPKEVLTLITWVVYLAMVHYRITAGWRGRRVAWLSIGGFIAVLITFIGARAMGGYHVFG